jgi:hypothetical protein
MAENNKFKDDINGGEDNVNGKDADNAAAADVQQIPPLMIPEGIDPAVAELLKMQHQNQWMMIQAIMNNQMAQMENNSTTKLEKDKSSPGNLPSATVASQRLLARHQN